ncbi:MAG: NERD domain-containing protein, partial [Clostridiales bacterium]|nr:NERD domain-containing protein [Clostridiales bacterium]
MAKIIKRENNLVKPYEEHKKKGIRFFTIGGILFLLEVITFPLHLLTFGLSFIITMPIGLGAMVCIGVGAYNLNKSAIYKSGLVGEAISEGVLNNLPDDYYVFPSIDIEFEGRKSQLDHLVVGPTGIFIVEAKNVNGHIVGNSESRDIIIHKIGQKGTPYQSRMYNPIKQVATHVYRTSSYLREEGISTWVQGMVYFTNPESTVNLPSNNIPVFSENEGGGRELYNYILHYDNAKGLSKDEIEIVVRAVKKNLNQQGNKPLSSSPYVTDYDI